MNKLEERFEEIMLEHDNMDAYESEFRAIK